MFTNRRGSSTKRLRFAAKLANENPAFAIAHDCLAYAYWGKRMYPQVIEEWKSLWPVLRLPRRC